MAALVLGYDACCLREGILLSIDQRWEKVEVIWSWREPRLVLICIQRGLYAFYVKHLSSTYYANVILTERDILTLTSYIIRDCMF